MIFPIFRLDTRLQGSEFTYLKSERKAAQTAIHLLKFRNLQRYGLVAKAGYFGHDIWESSRDQDKIVNPQAIRRVAFMLINLEDLIILEIGEIQHLFC